MRVVVVGLGYVGLPIVVAATTSGHAVTGVDTNSTVVRGLQSGRSHIGDIDDATIDNLIASGLCVTGDFQSLAEADVVVICVPTPLTERGTPDLTFVLDSVHNVANNLQPGQLILLESTTSPGTTENVVLPLLEQSGLQVGKDFFLAYSPERIDPGNAHYNLRNTPKVVGGVTWESTQQACAFYQTFIDTVVPAKGVREAEMSKLVENTYRQVNIALMNELVKFTHVLGVDLWNAIECASTKPFGFEAFKPGPGVGGHCIPIDPNYLSHHIREQLGEPFRFVELATEVNKGMPEYVVDRARNLLRNAGKDINASTVLLLGVTYKANVRDQRESPAFDIARHLMQGGTQVEYWDPHVHHWEVDGRKVTRQSDLQCGVTAADIAILLQSHSELDLSVLEQSPTLIFDTRGVLARENVERL